MANAIYPKAKESLLKGELDLEDNTIKVVLVDTGTSRYLFVLCSIISAFGEKSE